MLLTALAVVVGASVMLTDPIFQGLAISLMAGEIASLLVSRMAVPVLYFMAYNRVSLPAQSQERTPRLYLPKVDSYVEQNPSPAPALIIPGNRVHDAVSMFGKENNRAASDITAAPESR